MKYTFEIDINAPIQKVAELAGNPEEMDGGVAKQRAFERHTGYTRRKVHARVQNRGRNYYNDWDGDRPEPPEWIQRKL